jgi:hypothetical protein
MERCQRSKEAAQPRLRTRVYAGDFFLSVPRGGDAYILKSIIQLGRSNAVPRS